MSTKLEEWFLSRMPEDGVDFNAADIELGAVVAECAAHVRACGLEPHGKELHCAQARAVDTDSH